MGNTNLIKKLVLFFWLKLTRQMWLHGFGTTWMKKVVDNKGKTKK